MITFVKLLAWLAAHSPRRAVLRFARGIAWLLSRVVRLRRRVVLDALAHSFPEMSPRDRVALYNENCAQQLLSAGEMLRYAGGCRDELSSRLTVEGRDRAETANSAGRGVLVLIAHFGNYALLAMHVQRLFGYPLSIVIKRLRNEKINTLWFGQLKKDGVNAIESKNAYRACVKALRNKEFVGFMLDQNRPASSGVFVPFFGRPASTTPGLALLSAQTRAPVLPVFMRRNPDGTHHLLALPPIDPPPDHKPDTILRYTALYTRIIEDQIRQHPTQWLWWHKRWRAKPPPPEPAEPSPSAP